MEEISKVKRLAERYLKGKDFIVCLETAVNVHGLGNSEDNSVVPITIYTDSKDLIDSNSIETIYVEEINDIPREQVQGIDVTPIEYTLCDLIANEVDPQVIIDSLAGYIVPLDYNLELIKDYAKEMNVYDRLMDDLVYARDRHVSYIF